MSDYHLSLSIGKGLWNDLVGAALPMSVANGDFDLARSIYQGTKQLQVRKRVTALLENHADKPSVHKIRSKVSEKWQKHRKQVYHSIDQMFRMEGDWTLEVDNEGTDFHYNNQKIGVDAHIKGRIVGKLFLLNNNIELPFTVEKRLGATCHLGNIHFDERKNAVVGTVQDPAIDLGEHIVLKLLNEGLGKVLIQQVDKMESISLIQKSQLNEMLTPAGPLSMHIEDVRIEVTEEEMSLKVKFGFAQKQLSNKNE